MATILSLDQIVQREQAALLQQPSRDVKPKPFAKESELCDLLMREFNAVDGWVCYPEACGFDVLVVNRDGRQIGVQAKLSLNAKVADQILPGHGDDLYGRPGPDHRLVVVAKITNASAGIAKMLNRLGVKVLAPRESWQRTGYEHTLDIDFHLLKHERAAHGTVEKMFDWFPAERCKPPAIVTQLPAGVPSPVMLTPWKECALRVVALMRLQGYVTVRQIAKLGIGTSAWTQPASTEKPAWLAMGNRRGEWVETEHMPAFDKQHPELYEVVVRELQSEVVSDLKLI